MIKRLSVFLGLLIFVAGCSLNGGGSDYFPLKDGSKWEYDIEMFGPGNKLNGKMVIRIDGSEKIGGEKYFKAVSVISGIPGSEPEIAFYRPTKEGVMHILKKFIEQPPQILIPSSVGVGDTWEFIAPSQKLVYRVEAIESAELIERTYKNCLKVSVDGEMSSDDMGKVSMTGYAYYAPSVGMVKSIMEMKKWGSKMVTDISLSKHEK